MNEFKEEFRLGLKNGINKFFKIDQDNLVLISQED